MSRHVFESETHRVVVGWDQPLMTYYGQVHDLTITDEDDRITHWVPPAGVQLYEIDDLVLAMPREYRPWIRSLGATLYGDKDDGR